jgi:LPS export ABC transporter protein LptC
MNRVLAGFQAGTFRQAGKLPAILNSKFHLNYLQQAFAAFGLAYLLFLISVATIRSSSRHSLIGSLPNQYPNSARIGRADDPSKLSLKDFHRMEIKDGHPIWEVRAQDARYFPQDGVTRVNAAKVTIYRPKQEPVQLAADSARLAVSGSGISQATLEGNVMIGIDRAFSVKADLAEYNVISRRVAAPGKIEVSGEGFLIAGTGMDFNVDDELLTVRADVSSQFTPGAKAPSGLINR